jgi:hypothetical protein
LGKKHPTILTNMKLPPILTICALLLMGCGTPGIVHMDGDTYFIQKRSAQVGFGPPEAAKAEVYEIANKFCAERGMALETVDFKMVNGSFGRPGSVALQFRCAPLTKQTNGGVTSEAGQKADVEKRLRALTDLKERGLINDEEYQKKRTEILNAL